MTALHALVIFPAATLLAAGSVTAAHAEVIVSRVFAYPREGQTVQQQEIDHAECHYWAVDQTGYDPNFAQGSEPAERARDYLRAITACLEARGYTVR